MKTIIFILAFTLAIPCMAAEKADVKADEQKTEEKVQTQNDVRPEADKKPGEYYCQYYTVNLPADWQAILPPTENFGQVSAVFSKNGQNPSVTMTIAEHGSVPLKTIAEMFAEQFKAPKPPVLKKGQYIFSYTQNDVPNQVWVSTDGPLFMITAIGGNQTEGLNFLKENVKSKKYSSLFPK